MQLSGKVIIFESELEAEHWYRTIEESVKGKEEEYRNAMNQYKDLIDWMSGGKLPGELETRGYRAVKVRIESEHKLDCEVKK